MARQHDYLQTKDQLGRPENKALYVKRSQENLRLIEGPSVIEEDTIGHAWIVGSPTNGIVGPNTSTYDGQQQVVGGAGRVVTTKAVVNYNNKFIEKFRWQKCIDTGNTTATIDTSTSHEITFTNGEILQSNPVFYNADNIVSATINVTGTNTSNLSLQMSSDGGSNWENVTAGTVHIFTNVGQDLRYKVTATGAATLTEVTITYNR